MIKLSPRSGLLGLLVLGAIQAVWGQATPPPAANPGASPVAPPAAAATAPGGEVTAAPTPAPAASVMDPIAQRLLDEIDADSERLVPLFGQDLFREAVVARANQPADVAAPLRQPGPGFRIGPGDRVSITFFNALVAPTTVDVTVTADGNVAFDPVGIVQVNGLTVAEFQDRLTRLIQLRGPRNATVQYSFTDLHALSVRVTGEVRRPAARTVLSGYGSLVDALAQAGGPTPYGSLRHVSLIRDGQAQEVDLYDFLLTGNAAANPDLRDGDAIHVPVANRLVSVTGEVKRPARYELVNEQTVRQALDLAGGLTAMAARLQMQRVSDFETQTLVDLDVQQVLKGQADLSQVEPLRDGDHLLVTAAAKQARSAVTVEGAVGRPGEFGFRPGLTLGEVLRLAQGVTREGYGAVGTIRRLRADGQFDSINFEVAKVLAGGADAETPLQASDVVTVPLPEDRPKMTVAISGAVMRPARYQTSVAMTLGDLINQAGGLAPNADLARAQLSSVVSGSKTSQTIDLSALPRGGQPVPNPVLQNGDELSVPFVVTVRVRVSGQVRTPGTHDLTEGMTVQDLLKRANGLLPKALPRAELQRIIPGTAEMEKVYLDLARAEAGEASDNPVLREGDHLVVFSADDYSSSSQPYIAVQGAVRRPGPMARNRGMRVSEVIRNAGLDPAADRDQALILRRMPNGLNQQIRFSPTLAMAGNDAENPELADGDVVEFLTSSAITIRPATASVTGAVYRPGPVLLAANMTVDDLVMRAGGFLPTAFRQRVILRRKTPDDKSMDLILDMRGPLSLPVQRDDQLIVQTWEQTRYRNPTVEVLGDVQRQGKFERTEGLTISGLLFMAGGLLRPPEVTRIEIARATDTGVVPFRPDTVRLLAGDPAQDLVLEDEDRIYVRAAGPEPVRDVLVKGEVVYAGFHPILDKSDTLGRLIERVQLKTETAFPEGTVLLRRVDEITEPQVARLASSIYRSLAEQRRRQDLATLLASTTTQADPDLLEKVVGGSSDLPTDAVTDTYTDLFEVDRPMFAQQVEAAMSARSEANSAAFELPDSLKRYVRVPVDLNRVMAGEIDLPLRPNDLVVIPRIPETVLVEGEVNSNMAQLYVPGDRVSDYIRRAGGVRRNGDTNGILLVRANGTAETAKMSTPVRRGDMILVQAKALRPPTKPMTIWEQMQSLGSVLGGLATTVLAVTNAVK